MMSTTQQEGVYVPQPGLGLGVPAQQPQAVYVMLQSAKTPDKEHFQKNFPFRIISALSAAQVFIFLVVLVADIVVIANERYGPSDIGSGIWCGVFIGVAGALGLIAAWKPTSCSIVALMVMQIISACFTIPFIVFAGIGFGSNVHSHRWSGTDEERRARATLLVVLYGILMACSLVSALIAIVCAVFCCRVTCCRPSKTTGAVIYNPTGNDGAAVPAGAIAIPVNSLAVPAVASEVAQASTDSPPPKYEEAGRAGEGDKYQRFD